MKSDLYFVKPKIKVGVNISNKKTSSLFTIRNKKKAKHPYVIVGASRTKFSAMNLTHSKDSNHRKNILLTSNPNQKDNKPSYVRKQVVDDWKYNFSKAFKNYNLSDKDIEKLSQYLEKKKKK